jgi:diguanylate cyclase (GGDEF)-like protein/PAS domain S-box-containing protein
MPKKSVAIKSVAHTPEDVAEIGREELLLKAGALQSAIFNSANFSSIATDAKGVIQIFNVGAERMLGYAGADVMNKITPADISDPQELIARAMALSAELDTPITPGFEALVFKASRGIEDIYELTYIRKDGSHFPAVVSVTALRDDQGTIIGYLLIGTDNTARKLAEDALLKAGALQSAIFNSANFSSIATDAKGVIQIFNVGAERMLGYAAAEVMNKITPADISDPHEVIARAKALSAELGTPITPGFEALVFKASRGIEDIYELTYIRKDGSQFPAVVSVTALRDDQGTIIGYLLIGTDNTARKQVEADKKKLSQRLRDYQFYTRSLFESNIDALMTSDADGIITDINKQMEALTDCTRDELIGSPFKNYFTDPEKAEAGINQVLRERKVTNYELIVKARNGKETPVSYNAVTLYDRDRILQGVFAAARDITEHKRAEEALRESESRFRFMLENSPIAVCIADVETAQLVFANQSYAELINAPPDRVIGINPIYYYANAQDYQEVIKQLGKGGTVVNKLIELRVNSEHSVIKWALASYLMLEFQNQPAIMGWFYDISERKQMEDQVRQLAFYDPLTGLPNRRLLDDRLAQAIIETKRNGHYKALMVLDLDNFKSLNDTHGHAIGDLLLIEASTRLKNCVRGIDSVARFGGDEFVVLLNELDLNKEKAEAQTAIVAEKIRAHLAEPYLFKIKGVGDTVIDIEHHCTSSIGVVVFTNQGANAEDLFMKADSTMYKAKEAGRNQTLFFDSKAVDPHSPA